jgi:hypothetical protein
MTCFAAVLTASSRPHFWLPAAWDIVVGSLVLVGVEDAAAVLRDCELPVVGVGDVRDKTRLPASVSASRSNTLLSRLGSQRRRSPELP